MNLTVLTEPELEFGAGGRHVDIRFGIMHHGPFDAGTERAPSRIRLGLIGTPANLEGVQRWLDASRQPIPGKNTPKQNLFPRFPGFVAGVGFHSTLTSEAGLERTLSPRAIEDIAARSKGNILVREVVGLFLAELSYLHENERADVVVCAVPEQVAALLDPSARVPDPGQDGELLDFHDLLKAKAMDLGLPVQLILPSTYSPEFGRRQKKRPDRIRQLQDDATRAWNFHAALYYKAGGLPWRLLRSPSQLTTCYIGVGFYRSLEGDVLRTSMAQVFDERGDGIVVRGGPVRLPKHDRTPHLDEAAAQALLNEALMRYREVHKTLPARVVVHKTSPHNDAERRGFLAAVRAANITTADLLSLSDRGAPRLFRAGRYPPLRGTALTLEPGSAVLYTRGSVPFYETYPGLYVPQPLLVRSDEVEESQVELLREILALSKMNWNQTQFDGETPITLAAVRKVGPILRHVGDGDRVAPRYSYYM